MRFGKLLLKKSVYWDMTDGYYRGVFEAFEGHYAADLELYELARECFYELCDLHEMPLYDT